jgi:Tfp pilus assembly protein PilN
MSHALNFIPTQRQLHAETQRLVHQWTLALAVFGSVVLVVAGLVYITYSNETQIATEAIESVRRRMETSKSMELLARREAVKAQAELIATRAVGRPPDWTIVLGLLAAEASGQLAIDTLTLTQAEASDPSPTEMVTLLISGRTKSSSSISEFVVSLEKSGLFDKVKLLSSTLDADRGLLAFQIQAEMHSEMVAPAAHTSTAITEVQGDAR